MWERRCRAFFSQERYTSCWDRLLESGDFVSKSSFTNQKQKNTEISKILPYGCKKLTFGDNRFDVIISFDVFEHLYPEELQQAMSEISRVLKKDGTLLVHTEANKLYLDFTHGWYAYPVSTLLIRLNNLITRNHYEGLPKDPRNDNHKKQHVNEPTIFYLRQLFGAHQFSGQIISNISMLKKILSWKDYLYNICVLWYPFCFVPPFSYFFAYDYICIMKNKKIYENSRFSRT